MKEKLGQEQAFPMEQHDGNDLYDIHHGMSKRFYAACAVLQGIVSGIYSNKEMFHTIEYSAEKNKLNVSEFLVRESYIAADELLKQENEQ